MLNYWFMFSFIRKNLFKNYFYKGLKKYDLLIYDDFFPNPKSGFRYEEFTYYMENINNLKFLLTPKTYVAVGESANNQAMYIENLKDKFPKFFEENKVTKFGNKGIYNINTKLFYCVFINNIAEMLPILEKNKIPFVFTLYPGGGFGFEEESSDAKLKKVLSSKYFKKVIVTQRATYEYLVRKNFCPKEKIPFIFGGAMPQKSFSFNVAERLYYPDKKTLDICFCAGRYTEDGRDKGYPIFIEVMKKLSPKYDFIKFHVIGNYNPSIIDISGYEDKIKFYGSLPYDDLAGVFRNIDIIVSPNKSDLLSKGAFDGFPLGSVIEAALNGCLVMNTDPNNENFIKETGEYHFIPDLEMIIIQPDSDNIIENIEKIILSPKLIKEIAFAGQQKFIKLYNNEAQMKPRLELLKSFISN